jgi:hypothetical protein
VPVRRGGVSPRQRSAPACRGRPLAFSSACHVRRSGQPAADQRRSSSVRHKTRPPSRTGAGNFPALFSLYQLASEMPRKWAASGAGTSNGSMAPTFGLGGSASAERSRRRHRVRRSSGVAGGGGEADDGFGGVGHLPPFFLESMRWSSVTMRSTSSSA